MSVNAYLTEVMTRHAVFVERYGGGTWRKDIAPIIAKLRDDLASAIINAQLTQDQLFRINTLIADTDALVLAATVAMQSKFDVALPAFAEYEAGFTQRVLGKVLTVELAGLSVETVAAAATNTTLTLVSGKSVEQLTVSRVLDTFSATASKDISSLLRAGVVEGRTNQELARDVRRMVGSRTAQQAEALTRTVTASVSAQASRAVGDANRDVLAGEKWVATLDSRTTLVCAGRDGQIYDIGAGPYPPAHYNCRSRRVWVVKPEFAVPGFEGKRASYEGPVDAKTTFGSWLKKQSKEFQDDVLGPERAALFRSGEVSIDRFTDDAGRTLTLDELRSREGLTL